MRCVSCVRACAVGSLLSVLENKPLNRCTSEARRKKSREPFVQDGPCSDMTPKLSKCRECKLSQGQRGGTITGSQLANNIFCRFYAFRKQVFIFTVVRCGRRRCRRAEFISV